jgi:hypothetical protein
MADYYPVINRVVSLLPNNTRNTRQAVYDRARSALLRELQGHDPPLSKSDMAGELLALNEAIARVEGKSRSLIFKNKLEGKELVKVLLVAFGVLGAVGGIVVVVSVPFSGEPIVCSFEPRPDITGGEVALIIQERNAYLDHVFYQHPELRRHFPNCEDIEAVPIDTAPMLPHYSSERTPRTDLASQR